MMNNKIIADIFVQKMDSFKNIQEVGICDAWWSFVYFLLGLKSLIKGTPSFTFSKIQMIDPMTQINFLFQLF